MSPEPVGVGLVLCCKKRKIELVLIDIYNKYVPKNIFLSQY